MALFEQLKRSFRGSFMEDERSVPLDPTLPDDSILAAWARDRRNRGPLESPTVKARHRSPCGDSVQYSFLIEDDRLVAIGVVVKGCAYTAAAAHYLAAQVKGRTLEEALEFSPMDVYRAIPEIGDDHLHCAILAIIALHKGLSLHSLNMSDEAHPGFTADGGAGWRAGHAGS